MPNWWKFARPPRRLVLGSARVLLVAFGIVVFSSGPAAAHTDLLDTNPPNAATVLELPDALGLTFANTVDDDAVAASVTDVNGRDLGAGPVRVNGDTVTIPVRSAPPGPVVLAWSLVGPDGHPLSGELSWTVDPTASAADLTPTHSGADQAKSEGSDWPDRLSASGRMFTYAALALLLGLPVFFFAVWPEGTAHRLVPAVLIIGAGLGVVGPMLRLSATAGALQAPRGWWSGLTLLLGTGAGRALVAQVALVPIVTQAMWHAMRPTRWAGRGPVVVASATSVGLVWSVVQQGHGREASTFGTFWQTVHVGAMSVWVGALLGLVVLALPEWSRRGTLRVEARARIAAFAVLAGDAVAALLVSGGFLLVDRWSRSDGLARPYLTVLGIKGLAVGATVAVAASGRRWVRDAQPQARIRQPARKLLQMVTREIGLVGAVLAATAVLSGTPPLPAAASASRRDAPVPVAQVDLSGPVNLVPVTGRSFAFEPAQLSVPAGVPFEIALRVDDADTMHDLVIDGQTDKPVGALPGMTGSGFFQIDEPGEYLFYCGIEGHRAAGMTGTLVVTE